MTADPERRSERRRAPRIPCKIEMDMAHTGPLGKGKLEDLSIYGAFLQTNNLPPQTAMVRLTFRVRLDRDITLRARVIWQRRTDGVGVEFVETTPGDVKDISEYLASLD